MAASNIWTHYPSGVSECEIRHESGMAGTVILDTADFHRLCAVQRFKRIRLMTESSGRVYCVARISSPGQTLLHRWVLGVADKGAVVHHKNGNTLDNRRCNLEITTQRENIRQREAWGGSSHKGVYMDKRDGTYYATVSDYGYATPEEAAVSARAMRAARDSLSRKVAS